MRPKKGKVNKRCPVLVNISLSIYIYIFRKEKSVLTLKKYYLTYTCFLVAGIRFQVTHVVMESAWKPNSLFLSSYAASSRERERERERFLYYAARKCNFLPLVNQPIFVGLVSSF